jgi:predicted transposase/invertase (TIGR01784 family)
MKTDKWFYQLFLTMPGIIAELIPNIPSDCEFDYIAPVIKEREFRLDGLFIPQSENWNIPLIFLEAQMQSDAGFYGRYFAEIFLYLQQYPEKRPWQGLLILHNRQQYLGESVPYQVLLREQVKCLYLEDLLPRADISPNLALLKLLVLEEAEAFHLGRHILEESETQTTFQQRLNLIETILVNKFPHLGTQEILRMLDLKTTDITQSRFYQEVVAVGRQEGLQAGLLAGEADLILRQLTRKYGTLTPEVNQQIKALTIAELGDLGEALLDFVEMSDLENWLGHCGSSS